MTHGPAETPATTRDRARCSPVLGGLAIAAVPNADFSVVVLPGLAALSGLFLGTLITACGPYLLSSPQVRSLIALAAVMLSLSAFVTTNPGGLIIGMVLGVVD